MTIEFQRRGTMQLFREAILPGLKPPLTRIESDHHPAWLPNLF